MKKHDFKVGDKVLVINNSTKAFKRKDELFEVGDVTTVTGILGKYVCIGDGSLGNIASSEDLQLVKEENNMIKLEVGKKYKVIRNEHCESLFSKNKFYKTAKFLGRPALRSESGTYYWEDELAEMGIVLKSGYNFEEGQKYRVIDTDSTAFTEGDIYTVKKVNGANVIMSDFDSPYAEWEIDYFGITLELVHTEYIFKEGQKYLVVDNNTFLSFKKGKIYTVKKYLWYTTLESETGTYYTSKEIEALGIILEKVKLDQDYNFKKGQCYLVIESDYEEHFKEGKAYEVTNDGWNGVALISEKGTKFYPSDFGNKNMVSHNIFLKLVKDVDEETREEPVPDQTEDTNDKKVMIEIDFLMEYIDDNQLEPNEILAFLRGYKKGEEFKHD